MAARPIIVFYGDSLVLAGIRASMRASMQVNSEAEVTSHVLPQRIPGFELIILDATASIAELLDQNPSVVIFDMQAISPKVLQKQTQALPNLLLVGVDAESHAVLLAGNAAGSISPGEILQIIQSNGSKQSPFHNSLKHSY